MARALRATAACLDDYRRRSALEVFDDGVAEGISHELAAALVPIVRDAESSSVSIEFENLDQLPTLGPTNETFEFQASDAPVLETVAERLVEVEPINGVNVQGRVHLLTREAAGTPGVVGVDDGRRRYRVRLSVEDAHRATQAFDEEHIIAVRGRLERDGNRLWLYEAVVTAVFDPASASPPNLTPSLRTLWDVSD